MSVLDLQQESELIERAQQGSVEAFEQLVIHFQDRLYRFLLVRAANRADAEDALQETFVAAYRHLPGYRSKYRFSTWLFSIALRQLGRQRRPGSNAAELSDSVACRQAGPEQLGIQREQRRSIWQTARNCLGETQFTALWFFYVEELPVAEIGKIMKRPDGWVRVNLLRARRRLSRELREHEMAPAVSCKESVL